jgi:hypothetical protein
MEGIEAPQTPQPSRNFNVGDLVHVCNGTAAGTRGYKTIAYMGTVVGYDVQVSKWLVCGVLCLALSWIVMFNLNLPDVLLWLSLVKVRNSMVAKKGQPNRVEDTFMSRSRTLLSLLSFSSHLFSSILISSHLFSSLLFSS